MTKRIRRKEVGVVLRACRRASAILALCLVFMNVAQSPSVLAQPSRAQEVSEPLRPEEKPTFWLVDEDGAWRTPLPNWTLEEVMRVVDSRNDAPEFAPWAIQSVDATGFVADGLARLQIEIAVNVAEGVTRAPLGLSEGIYIPTKEQDASGESSRGGFSYVGPGLCALDVDRKTGEYFAIFQTPFPTAGKEEDSSQNVRAAENAAPEVAPASAASENASAPGGSQVPSATPESAPARVSREPGLLRPYQYLLTLELSFSVEKRGHNGEPQALTDPSDEAERRLVATFPPSLHSQLTLMVPESDVAIVSVKGASVAAPTTMSEDDDVAKSELRLRGLGRGGERVEFSWRRKPSRDPNRLERSDERKVVYQSEDATIVVELDALGTTYDATLPIRVVGGESDVFVVELPRDATLSTDEVVAFDTNGNSLEVLECKVVAKTDPDDGASDLGGDLVHLRLAKKTSLLTLRLKARAPASDAVVVAGQKRAPRQIAGFRVENAQIQFGQVRIVKSHDSDFNVSPVYGASGALDVSLNDGSEVYAFFSQPFLMTAEGYARETVVDVRPEYLTTVSRDELKLRARFLYSVYGSKIRELRMRLNGWSLSRVYDTENVLNEEGIVPSNDRGEAVFPLATPSDGELLVEFEFVHDVERDQDAYGAALSDPDRASCSVSFPTPSATRIESASIVILPQNDVELTPNEEATKGLAKKTARSFSVNLEIPSDARQTPLYYQARLGGENASAPLFVADIRRLAQQTWVDVKTDATISEKGLFHVNETFEYRIEHEPIGVFELQAPTRLVEALRDRGVKCFVDGRQHNLAIDPPEDSEPTTEERPEPSTESERAKAQAKSRYANCRVVVDTPRIGSCVITLQYDLDPIDIREGLTNQVRVELFQPKSNQSSWNNVTNELTLNSPVGFGLGFTKPSRRRGSDANDDVADAGFQSFWNAEPRKFSDDGKTESIRCSSLVAEFSARFSVTLDSREHGISIVDRAWVQSWFSKTARVDRVVWKMNCDRDYVEIRLPEHCSADRVSVSIDGERLPVGGDARYGLVFHEQIVRIPISAQRRRKEIALEVAYVVANVSTSKGGIVAEFPDFAVDSVWIRRVYWQTIFNRNRIVVVDPREWTPEFIVKRGAGLGALLYRRVPTMTQDALCDWVGIGRREPIPQEANVYLYSRFCESPARPSVSSSASEPRERERTLPSARLLVADNAFIVFLGSGLVLALGLGLVYLQVMSARQAFFTRWALISLCGLALIFASLRPLLALLFLQTTALGALLTLIIAALTAWQGRGESNNPVVGEANAGPEKGA